MRTLINPDRQVHAKSADEVAYQRRALRNIKRMNTTPKKPHLPKEDIKIIIRPRDGFNTARYSVAQIGDCILRATGLKPEEELKDSIRINERQNIIVVSAPTLESAEKYSALKELRIGDKTPAYYTPREWVALTSRSLCSGGPWLTTFNPSVLEQTNSNGNAIKLWCHAGPKKSEANIGCWSNAARYHNRGTSASGSSNQSAELNGRAGGVLGNHRNAATFTSRTCPGLFRRELYRKRPSHRFPRIAVFSDTPRAGVMSQCDVVEGEDLSPEEMRKWRQTHIYDAAYQEYSRFQRLPLQPLPTLQASLYAAGVPATMELRQNVVTINPTHTVTLSTESYDRLTKYLGIKSLTVGGKSTKSPPTGFRTPRRAKALSTSTEQACEKLYTKKTFYPCFRSIGFAHKPCMERWVSERREEECNICHYSYPILRRTARTFCDLLRHPEGRKEPLVYALLGVLFSLSLLHVFAFAWILSVRMWVRLPWMYQLLNAAALLGQSLLWSVFPFVAFRMAWESSRRWCLLNAEMRILLPEDNESRPPRGELPPCQARKTPLAPN
ncbi:hypothetical protein HPB49_016830 [Dermacentor silvarum]|uniref:Uncharacterized protein n=1 Tax=Dermacentor silvarum TaxID=543639 RepID=A0ACB8CSK0_DERSI|nr:hypothetical protein HPB49_016830 [Dermacentor silvarum]